MAPPTTTSKSCGNSQGFLPSEFDFCASPETEVTVDEFGVEWVQVPDVEEEPTSESETVERGTQSQPQPKKCRQLEVHKEWRDLSATNKRSYMVPSSASKAAAPSTELFLRSSLGSMNSSSCTWTLRTAFMEWYISSSRHSTDILKLLWVYPQAQFLPWHRHFGYLYHQALNSHISISTLIKAIL